MAIALTGYGSHTPVRVSRGVLHVRLLPSNNNISNTTNLERPKMLESALSRGLPIPIMPGALPEHHRPVLVPLPEIITDNHYYLPDEVDIRAQPIHLAVLIYPKQAYLLKISGRVRLRVFINENGEIDSVDVVEANPPEIFEEAALKAMLATHFEPAEIDGSPVKSQKLIEINFNPYERTTSPGNLSGSEESDQNEAVPAQ